MKKLNRKGFTLIELLAVIVILAIVVVITIPSVISSINKAKEESLKNATATVTEWFTKQYEIATLGSDVAGDASAEYTTFVGSTGLTTTAKPLTEEVLKAAGITNPTGLITGSSVKLNGTKVCVILKADSTSQFYVNGSTNSVTGSGC